MINEYNNHLDEFPGFQKEKTMKNPFSQEQLDVLCPALTAAISNVRDVHRKTDRQIDGDIFTNTRRELQYHQEKSIARFFGRKYKNSLRYNHKEWELISFLIERIKVTHLETETNDSDLMNLRLHLSDMRDAECRMTRLESDAEKVVEKLITINRTLNGD